jgi:hypothetical protein
MDYSVKARMMPIFWPGFGRISELIYQKNLEKSGKKENLLA